VEALSNDVDRVFDAWLKEYKGKTLIHKCDGTTQHQWLTPINTYSIDPKPCEKLAGGSCNCKETGMLFVAISALGVAGYFRVLTHSKNDIVDLSCQLRMIKKIKQGNLFGTPLLLSRSSRSIATNYNGKRGQTVKSLLSIEIHPDVAVGVLEKMKDQALETPSISEEIALTEDVLPEEFGSPEVDVEHVAPVRSYAELQALREKLGWSKEDVIDFLVPNYQVHLPSQLTDDQYESLLNDLRVLASRPTPAPVVQTIPADDIPL
jgi:hypothetical protein